jgi:hypothetical protein
MLAYRLIIDDKVGGLAGGISSWKWLHITCVILTFVVAVPLIFFLPNNPSEARWLTTKEKVQTIQIIRDTHAGISNKSFKWAQVGQCFSDVKSWLFM